MLKPVRQAPLILVMAAVTLGCPVTTAADVVVSTFDPASAGLPVPWQLIRLEPSVPPTNYRQIFWDGVAAIEARAEASMALLGRPLDIDLTQTPVLCWRWRIDSVVRSADMTRRRGDDYAARIYLAFSLPRESLSLAERAALSLARGIFGPQVPDGAINFVWDNRHTVGTRMPNAYTSRAQMIVQRSGNAEAGLWVGERVNVLQEMERTFGTSRASCSCWRWARILTIPAKVCVPDLRTSISSRLTSLVRMIVCALLRHRRLLELHPVSSDPGCSRRAAHFVHDRAIHSLVLGV